MKKNISKILPIFLAVIICTQCICVSVTGAEDLDSIVIKTAEYIINNTPDPQVGSVGGEWAVIGLLKSGADISENYYQNYYNSVLDYIKEREGILHEQKNTEYARVSIALCAIGKNPLDAGGYNLLKPLGDYDRTISQGLNGAIWAVKAIDCADYDELNNEKEKYIKYISECQNEDGSWSLSAGGEADIEVTAMALQALAKYQNDEDVKRSSESALKYISENWSADSSESCAQVIIALCEMGISISDPPFVKDGRTLLDALLTFSCEDGGFKHIYDESSSNQMASEQCLCALAALKRQSEGKSGLYTMDDEAINLTDNSNPEGLAGKHADVKISGVVFDGRSFDDIQEREDKGLIEELAKRDIINGKSEDSFDPDATMTRAEFAAIIARGLGLMQKDCAAFNDVTENDWFFGYVGAAYNYKIVSGISDTEFNPNGTITREEAAVMTARAAKLCGMNTDIETFAARDILAEFMDYVKASDWAVSSLAFCYREGILSDDAMEIKPKEEVTRAEIASMLFYMLRKAKLL